MTSFSSRSRCQKKGGLSDDRVYQSQLKLEVHFSRQVVAESSGEQLTTKSGLAVPASPPFRR